MSIRYLMLIIVNLQPHKGGFGGRQDSDDAGEHPVVN